MGGGEDSQRGLCRPCWHNPTPHTPLCTHTAVMGLCSPRHTGASPGHTWPGCHTCPSCDCVPCAHPATVHTHPLCSHPSRYHVPHVTLSLVHTLPVHIPCEPPCPLHSHTPHVPHTPSPTGLRRAPECARHSRATQGAPEHPVSAPSTHTGVPAHGRLCTWMWLPTLLLPPRGHRLQGHGLCWAMCVSARRGDSPGPGPDPAASPAAQGGPSTLGEAHGRRSPSRPPSCSHPGQAVRSWWKLRSRWPAAGGGAGMGEQLPLTG